MIFIKVYSPSSICFRLLCDITTPSAPCALSSSTNFVKYPLDDSFAFCNALKNVDRSFSSSLHETSSVNVLILSPFRDIFISSVANVRLILKTCVPFNEKLTIDFRIEYNVILKMQMFAVKTQRSNDISMFDNLSKATNASPMFKYYCCNSF